jgi:hypothetical protein
MRFPLLVNALVGTLLLLACGSSTAPSLDGLAFLRASLNGHSWVSDPLRVSAALHPGKHLVVQGQQEVPGVSPPYLLSVGTQITGVGTFQVPAAQDGTTDGAGYVGSISPGLRPNSYLTDSVHTGTLTISHFDTVAHVVTGAFTFSAVSADHLRVRVTQGTFRASYFVVP